jgi:hypothetical protein
MNLLKLFDRKPKMKLRRQYAPIHRLFNLTQKELVKQVLQKTCVKHRIIDNLLVITCTEFEISAYLYALLIRKLKGHNQNPLVQEELKTEFDFLHQNIYGLPIGFLKDPLRLVYTRVKQYSEHYEEKYGYLKNRANLIEAIIAYKKTGSISETPVSFLEQLNDEQIGKLLHGSEEIEMQHDNVEDIEDENLQFLSTSHDIFWSVNLFGGTIDNLFKKCPDLTTASEEKVIELSQEWLKA